MYEIEKQNYLPDNIYAGDFPVEISVETANAKLEKNTVVALNAQGKLEQATAENLANIYGITADKATEAGAKIAVYLTGAYRAEALNYGTTTADKVKLPLRNIGIFIK